MEQEEGPVDENEILLMQAEIGKDTPTLDLHGLTVEEAEVEIEKFLNHEFLAGHRTVQIIHGKGTGKLQAAVKEYLESHPLVAAFRPSSKSGQAGAAVNVILVEKE